MYKYTDKAIDALKRYFIRSFRKLYLLDFDELNVVNQVVTVYAQADRAARKAYKDIAIHAYLFALAEAVKAGFDIDVPDADATPISDDWIQDMLFEADPVTLYEYMPEWGRKRQRLIEALAATNSPKKELDKALRYLVLQVSHYADKSTAQAALQAYKDAGVKRVMWVTERDNRVCTECTPLDGKVFDIDKVPPLPVHYRCRCRVKPLKSEYQADRPAS